jgi:hypothetical protein
MTYGQWAERDGQWRQPGNDGEPQPPQLSYAQTQDIQSLGEHAGLGDGRGGQRAGGDERWQPPEWRFGQQRQRELDEHRRYLEQFRANVTPARPSFTPAPPGFTPARPSFTPAPPSQQGITPTPPPYYQPQPYQQLPYLVPRRGQSWPERHKVVTGTICCAALVTVIAAANSVRLPASQNTSMAANVAATTATAAPVTDAQSHATAATASAHKAQPATKHTPPAASHSPATHAPTRATHVAPVPPSAHATPAGCRPLTNQGRCYEPGEYCRGSNHGGAGRAGDGRAIICEDMDGWRWEPASAKR